MKIDDKGALTAKAGRTHRVERKDAKVSFADRLAAKQQELTPDDQAREREVVEAVGMMVARNAQKAAPPAQIEQEKPDDEEW